MSLKASDVAVISDSAIVHRVRCSVFAKVDLRRHRS
jgi:hypothetical protein